MKEYQPRGQAPPPQQRNTAPPPLRLPVDNDVYAPEPVEEPEVAQPNYYVIVVFVVELLLLGGVCALACILRFTDKFTLRSTTFSCFDTALMSPYIIPDDSNIYIPDLVLYLVGFLLPPVLIVTAELFIMWASTMPQKTIHVFSPECNLPQVVRRIIRNVGMFLLGALVTAILTDMLKVTIVRPRPYFLSVCEPANCVSGSGNYTMCKDDVDADLLREARMSFPSFWAAFSMYCAIFASIYVHSVMAVHGVRLLRPIVVFALFSLSLMCGVVRLQDHRNYPGDVAAGFLLGFFVALYLGYFCLDCFKENHKHRLLEAIEDKRDDDDDGDVETNAKHASVLANTHAEYEDVLPADDKRQSADARYEQMRAPYQSSQPEYSRGSSRQEYDNYGGDVGYKQDARYF
ncbi:PREDICTED: lipid phosphate phosphatase-related protein type 5-like [Priapulus caudatus]|uniref:Lipid phosphate phosphatase-related protein type 5-like n=1 Tax=Priapulus caudatus TaxID=37621 RepID=A0ABM1E1U3_PRICU|nr:PREDICTED: lipid phosphate phosphatase-related protein type 5-like [Priapulus caudatus]